MQGPRNAYVSGQNTKQPGNYKPFGKPGVWYTENKVVELEQFKCLMSSKNKEKEKSNNIICKFLVVCFIKFST